MTAARGRNARAVAPAAIRAVLVRTFLAATIVGVALASIQSPPGLGAALVATTAAALALVPPERSGTAASPPG